MLSNIDNKHVHLSLSIYIKKKKFMNRTFNFDELSLIHNVYDLIKNYQYFLLAFSGGLDSTVLLDILAILCHPHYKSILKKKTFTYFRVIHINHGINNSSSFWELHCKKQCKLYGLSFHSIKINFLNKPFSNLEELARNHRYQLLFNSLLYKEVLLTAHHLDDQVETFFLALKKGSGPRGLSSMKIVNTFNNKFILRPLLGINRVQLEQYATKKKLSWINDITNQDNRFDRNYLRNNIIPLFKIRWPTISKTIARSAQLCAEQEQLVDELLENTLSNITHYDGSLCIKYILFISNVKRNALLRRWLCSKGSVMPSQDQILYIWKHIVLCRHDASPILKLGQKLLLRFRNRLYLFPFNINLNFSNIIIMWNKELQKILLPNNLGVLINTNFNYKNLPFLKFISYSKVRAPLDNEKVFIKFGNCHINYPIYIIGRKHCRKLKKIWQELNVPPWERKKIPLVFYNDKLITALGKFITQGNQICSINNNWKIKWFS